MVTTPLPYVKGSLDDWGGLQFNVLTLDPNQPWKFPPSLLQKLDLEITDATDDTFRSRPPGPRHKIRRDNLERLLDEENDEWDGGSVMLKERLRYQMQKDALEPLGGNDLDDDGPLIVGSGGKLKPSAATDTEEDIEITDEMLMEVKEWLTLDVKCFSSIKPLDNLLEPIVGDDKTTKTARVYVGKVLLLLLVRYGI